MADCSEHGNESSDAIKIEEFLRWVWLQMWRVAVKIVNKHWGTADKGWYFVFEAGWKVRSATFAVVTNV